MYTRNLCVARRRHTLVAVPAKKSAWWRWNLAIWPWNKHINPACSQASPGSGGSWLPFPMDEGAPCSASGQFVAAWRAPALVWLQQLQLQNHILTIMKRLCSSQGMERRSPFHVCRGAIRSLLRRVTLTSREAIYKTEHWYCNSDLCRIHFQIRFVLKRFFFAETNFRSEVPNKMAHHDSSFWQYTTPVCLPDETTTCNSYNSTRLCTTSANHEMGRWPWAAIPHARRGGGRTRGRSHGSAHMEGACDAIPFCQRSDEGGMLPV
jgi:hypothetical protein